MNDQTDNLPQTEGANGGYQVLARKYRPQTFDALVGQDALVRTLTNAIREDRIAHAFILTGVRGVGKTTTARIIARALNCIGPDGKGGPTIEPCGLCEHCRSIADSRHVDVLEMDAASRTGVDNMRELLDGVQYRPVSARYKVYIIDEVHMLSMQAFNALLKTLEEPPEHVKFVFATTEIRKVPVTVLSRCQRFDLRRVGADLLTAHFRNVANQEKAEIDDEALALIANAAEGSVRDGLSLLDQAIAHGGGHVAVEQVRDMLGLADRARVFDLFETTMRGDVAGALQELGTQYDMGADPVVVLQDLLELTHWLTRLKVTPEAADRPGVTQVERERGMKLAEGLAMPVLARTWQMLLKGLSETRSAPSPLTALEMLLVRLAYAADLPTPADLARQIADGGPTPTSSPAPSRTETATAPPPAGGTAARSGTPAGTGATMLASAPVPAEMPEDAALPTPDMQPEAHTKPQDQGAGLDDLAAVARMAEERRDLRLYHELQENVRLVRFEPGRIEVRPMPSAANDLVQRLGSRLQEWTGERWIVTINNEAEGAPPLADQRRQAHEDLLRETAAHPLVKAVQDAFPGASIENVRPLSDGGEEDGT